MTTTTMFVIFGIGTLLSILVFPFSIFIGFMVWSVWITICFVYILLRFVNDVDSRDVEIEKIITDTEKAVTQLEKFTTLQVFTDIDEVKQLMSFVRSYQQSMTNFINANREL